MDNAAQYGQQDFNLPHDVVQLPSKGRFYQNGKSSVKVGYLTAADENTLLGQRNPDNLIQNLLRSKIYEPGLDVGTLLDCDVEAILIFLRNTSFGSEYTFSLRDPKTLKNFEVSTKLEELQTKEPTISPNEQGLFELTLPKSGKHVKCKLLTIGDTQELTKLQEAYPEGVVAPVITKRLEKHIKEFDGSTDPAEIASAIQVLPIADSKYIRNTLRDAEPRLDLERVFTAPSGEKVSARITFGAEFFRPFF